jgi:hypothetical protein
MADDSMTNRQPTRIDRPDIPAAYGVSDSPERVAWTHVEDRLAAAREYWVATVSTTGVPRVRPVCGLYVDGVLYVSGSPKSRWVADLAINPRVAVHLDGTADVVILDAEASSPTLNSEAFAERLATASNAKYPEFPTTPADYAGPGQIAIRPRKVIAWTDFKTNPTRFTFG